MQQKHFIKKIFLLPLFLLTSCNFKFDFSNLNVSINSTSNPTSSSSTTSTQGGNSLVNFSVFAINDYHGSINEDDKMPIRQLGSFVKQKKNESDHNIFIDSGDTWQGSLESNINKGNLITDVYNASHFDVRTIGNHDFDWGEEALKNNIEREHNGFRTATLGANIIDFDFESKMQKEFKSDLASKYTIIELDDIKIGVVGVIGQKQITSISTNYVTDIHFSSHIQTIKDTSRELRNLGCDVVIASVHAGKDEVIDNNLSSSVDLVLCAHTHVNEDYFENELPFVQCGGYGNNLKEIKIAYNKSSKKCTYYQINEINARTVKNTPIDMEINDIVNRYLTPEIDELGSKKILRDVVGNAYSSEQLPNMMCEAIYNYTVDTKQIEVDYTLTNNARASIYNQVWTYSDVYAAFPFDNIIFIANVPGASLINELSYNTTSMYRNEKTENGRLPIDQSKTYRIAIIDFMLLHTDISRNYNYFPSFEIITDSGGTTFRDMFCSYYSQFQNTLYTSEYNDNGKPCFDKTALTVNMN